jgi:hypothetical protein
MKNFIGGLFKTRENTERARQALQTKGFDAASMLVLRYTYNDEERVEGTKEEPSFTSIGRNALRGALVLGAIGGILGLLVGLGVIQVPSLEPAGGQTLPFEITWQFVLSSLAAGLILGGITGVILGAVWRLFTGYEKNVRTRPQTRRGDLMLAVPADDERRASEARSTMQEHGAYAFDEFHENWDRTVWSLLEA